jgi:hypothetical protein
MTTQKDLAELCRKGDILLVVAALEEHVEWVNAWEEDDSSDHEQLRINCALDPLFLSVNYGHANLVQILLQRSAQVTRFCLAAAISPDVECMSKMRLHYVHILRQLLPHAVGSESPDNYCSYSNGCYNVLGFLLWDVVCRVTGSIATPGSVEEPQDDAGLDMFETVLLFADVNSWNAFSMGGVIEEGVAPNWQVTPLGFAVSCTERRNCDIGMCDR